MTRGTAISPSTTEKPALTALSEHVGRRADRLFKLMAAAAGSTIVIAILLIAVFLSAACRPVVARQSRELLHQRQVQHQRSEQAGVRYPRPAHGHRAQFAQRAGAGGPGRGRYRGVPYAVRAGRLSRPFGAMVDLLAAVPSIIFGLWGIFVLAPKLEPMVAYLNRELGWLFLFKHGNVSLAGGGTIFTAGVVLR